jgi:hypothetical protein
VAGSWFATPQFATDGPKTGHGVLPRNAGFEVRYSDAGMADDALSEPDLPA